VRILVVGDERAIRFSLAELPESDGHEVREAEYASARTRSIRDGVRLPGDSREWTQRMLVRKMVVSPGRSVPTLPEVSP
jgi:hypothetical protein